MDRNVVIATVLIAGIMFVWLYLLAPPPPPPQDPTQDSVTDTQAVQQDSLLVAEDAEREGGPDTLGAVPGDEIDTSIDTSLVGATIGEARTITVETDLYQAQFSTKGATLTSFILKEYTRYDQETPVQLIDTTKQGALAISFTTPANHFVDSRSLFFASNTDADTLRVGEDPVTLAFIAQVGRGEIRQTYTFQADEYEVGLQVERRNAEAFSTAEGYELMWDGGIPFTENDPENEAQSAGAFARSGGEVESVNLTGDPYEEQRLAGNVTWTAVKSKYFAAVVLPLGPTRGAELIGERVTETATTDLWESYEARLLMPVSSTGVDDFTLYMGPMEFYRMAEYKAGLYDMVDYGWDMFEWMTRPVATYVFIPSMELLSRFIPNYGVIIIIIAILLKFALYPLTKTSYKSMARMRELQPQMEAIKEKYGDNAQKQQEEMMKMYKETGVNPLGGCLPMLLQYPIIIALWQFLPNAIEIRQQSFLWAHDLSAPDAILSLPFEIPFYGDFVAGFTLLMGISMVFQMKLQMTPGSNPQAKIFTYVFPVMIFAIFNRFASGLSLYYLVYNVVTAVQQQWINKHIKQSDEEEKGKEEKGKGKGKGRGKGKGPAAVRKKAKSRS